MNGLARQLRSVGVYVQLLKLSRIPYSHGGLWAGILMAQPVSEYPLWWSIGGIALFCLFYGGMYLMNDLLNYQYDLKDPSLKMRPLQSGKIPYWSGFTYFVALETIVFVLFALYYAHVLKYVILLFFVNFLYSAFLKYVAYGDVFFASFTQPIKMIIGGLLFASKLPSLEFTVVGLLIYILSVASHARKQSNRLLRKNPKEFVLGHHSETSLRWLRIAAIAVAWCLLFVYFSLIVKAIVFILIGLSVLLVLADSVPGIAKVMVAHDRVQSSW